jgi:hypothetical protein
MTAIVCYVGQHVAWCDWLFTQNSRYWHHKICIISCLNSQFLSQFIMKWSLCDDLWQTVVCGLSVVFHCRRYWLLLYSLQSYCNSTQNHLPYNKFLARHCALYTRMHMCMKMLLLLNCLYSHWNKILRAWKTPTDALTTVSLIKGNLF